MQLDDWNNANHKFKMLTCRYFGCIIVNGVNEQEIA